MSLLDDVSIVVTPNGYKAGELYAVVPVPTEGSEDVVNGDFASGGTSWNTNTGWTITTGIATSVGATADINQGVWSPNAQSQYQVTFEVKTITAGGVRFRFGGVFGATRTSTGIYTEIITTVDTERIRIASVSVDSSYFSGTITNISVKEYTASDMDVTRATAATRVDENGLVNYAEIIGSDLVTNGDFATDLSGWTISGNDATHTVTWTASGARFQSDTTSPVMEFKQLNLLTSSTQYVLTCDVTYTGSGTLKVNVGSNLPPLVEGSNTVYFTATSTTLSILRFNANVDAIIDNVSVKEVTRDNVPRIDYTGGGCPHILAEPQRTNLIPYSSDFSQWILNSVTLTANATTSPSGSLDATLVDLSSTTDSRLVNNVGVVASTEDTLSFYLKKHESDSDGTFPLAYYDGSDYIKTYVNLTDVWQRFDLTFTNPSGSIFGYGLSRKGTTSDETLTRCYAWGSQLEQASYPTSYIPTSGSTVTRNQDIFTRDGIGSLINSTEGVLFVEMAALSDDDGSRYISISDGNSNSNSIRIYYYLSGGYVFIQKYVGGTRTTNLSTNSLTNTDFNKIAIRYNSTTVDVWANGVQILTNADTNVIASGTLNSLKFTKGGGGDNFYGKVKQLQVYDTSLSDEQLLQLTGESGTDFYESYAEMASALTYTIQ